MLKNNKLCGYVLRVAIFTSLLGAIASGCAGFATPNVQPDNRVNNYTPIQTAGGQAKETSPTKAN